mgnify:CR=1 FL=1
MTSYLRRKRVPPWDTHLGPPNRQWRFIPASWALMLKKSKNSALSCSFEFGQWLFVSLIALVSLSTFPIMGSADNSSIAGIVFLDANNNGVYDPSESVQSGHNVYLEDLTLISQGQGGNFHATTNTDGEFYFTAQSVGNYNISIDLDDNMQLTAPFFAEGVMPPHQISVTENGQTVLINFGLSDATPDSSPVTSPSKVSGLFAEQIFHIDCNGNVDDQSEQKRSVENQGVTFVGGDRKKHHNMACFFGGDDYLKIANSTDTLSNFTISAWVSVFGTDAKKTRAIVSNYDGGGNAQHYGINMSKGVASVFYDDGVKLNGARDTGGTSLADEKWHHVAAVFEGGVNTKLYVDAEPRRQTSGTMPASISPTGALYIGRGGDNEGMEKRWRGSIDEVRIIKRVLSEDEITTLSTIIDLPTGETFIPTDPTGERDDASFFFNAKNDDGVVESLRVTPNSDGSFSLNNVSSNTTRRGVRDGDSETTLVIKDGEMTLIDETLPGVVTTINIAGDLEITDAATPDVKLILQRNSEQFAFQSISNPSLVVKVNADGSLNIIDENQPNITAIRDGEHGNIYVVDEETKTQAVIYGNGKTVVTHPDFPNIEASFNAYDSEESYTLTNTLTNECIEVPANGNVRRGVRGLFSSIGKVFKKGISSIGHFVRSGSVSFVAKVVKGARKLVRFAGRGIGKIGKFIGSGIRKVFGGIKNFFGNLFGGRKLKKTIKKLQGQISALQGQVHTLQATVQQQAEVINDLRQHIVKQDEIIAELRTIITQQAATITQQAEAIAALTDTVEQQKEIIASQATTIASLEQRISDLEDRTRSGEEGVDEIPDGDDISDTRRGIRDGSSNECRSIITPASCQVYGVQDKGLNDSIPFVYNPVDQTVKQIGETCQGCDLEAMAIHPVTDEIYLGSGDNAVGHPNGHLYKLDANTGGLRSLGVTGFEDISGLTFDDDGVLWGWAKGQGLVILDTETGQGNLELPSSRKLADLSWDSNYQVLYGVVGKELWSYDPTNGDANELCDNLPRKTEAIKALPASVLPAGLVWVGSHNNRKTELQAFEIATCQPQKDLNLSIGYDDVEGLAMPTAACQ